MTDQEAAEALSRIPQADMAKSILAAMARFVFKHAGQPLKVLRSEVNEQRAEIIEMRRRISELEAKNG